MAGGVTATCRCGEVVCEARGDAILTAVCYCDDCQAAAVQIEAGGGPPVADPDGGTALTLYRKDRFVCISGEDRLRAHKLAAGSPTNRYVAECCGSALYIGFDKGPHWVSVMSNCLAGGAPAADVRIMTRFRTSTSSYPDSAPTYAKYPWAMLFKLVGARIGMMFS